MPVQELLSKTADQAHVHSKQGLMQLSLLAQLCTAFDAAADRTAEAQAGTAGSTKEAQGTPLSPPLHPLSSPFPQLNPFEGPGCHWSIQGLP